MKRVGWILLIVVGLLLLATRLFLSSRYVSRQVAHRLTELVGAPVEVESASIPFFGDSTLRGVRILETGEPEQDREAWLRIERGTLDLSLWDVLFSSGMPDELTLERAHLSLRFDPEGNLLTRLPAPKEPTGEPLPRILLGEATVTLAQEGREPMTVGGINAVLADSQEGLRLDGTIADPSWGQWQAEAGYLPSSAGLTLHLSTPQATVTQARLEQIPMISPEVWRQVQGSGETGVDFRLRVGMAQAGPHYRVQLDLIDAFLHVSSIDLGARHCSGQILVEDALVRLKDVRGQAAAGRVATSGDLDFRPNPSRLELGVTLEDMRLRQLPASWDFPKPLTGLLSGEASLVLTIDEGVVSTSGRGEGTIEQAQWGRLKYPAPITLRLNADGARFRFTTEASPGSLSRGPTGRRTSSTSSVPTTR